MIVNGMLLLSLVFLALVALFKEMSARQAQFCWGNRDAFILAAITQGTILVIITEGLSAFHLFQIKYLLGSWALVLTISLLLFSLARISHKGLNRSLFNLTDWNLPHFKKSLSNSFLFVLIGIQLITLAAIAYIYPPTNYDSMTYHLARVMHWQQNQSVASYATNIDRQVQSQPFAEYELANLQILLNKDRYSNFVQYFAFLVCFVGVTNITKKLGGRPDQQILAGMLSISIPMAILQSTSTQNDLVLSEYLICFVSAGIPLIQKPDNKLWACAVGLSLGLACLTKATAFIFAFPFCIWFGISIIKNNAKNLVTGLAILVLVLFINGAFLMRNHNLYLNPLGSTAMYGTTNETHTFKGLVSTSIRNIALNFTDRDNPYSKAILGGFEFLHQLTGLNSTDPQTTLTNWNVFDGVAQFRFFNEDYAGNPLHAILIFLTICFSFYTYTRFSVHKNVLIYEICLCVGFLIFSFYLKFQIWGSRLLLPLFILWAPIIIIFLVEKNEKISKLFIASILIFSFLWTFGNISRGLNVTSLGRTQDRESLYFTNQPGLYPVYFKITNQIKSSHCQRIGLSIGQDTWEYPLWVMLKNRNWVGRIEHINITNPTAALADPNFKPCAIISDGMRGAESFPLYTETEIGSYFLFEQK